MFKLRFWDKSKPKTAQEDFSLDGLIAWLKQHPVEETYKYISLDNCLSAQFHKYLGRKFKVFSLGPLFSDIPGLAKVNFEQQLEAIAVTYPETFGAALERAQRIKEEMERHV